MHSAAPSETIASRPSTASLLESWPAKAIAIVSATVFVALCAHVSLPLPFTPVPLTLSDFAVLVVGMMLGPVAGFSALVLYLAEGAMGAPVFNPIGLGGVAQLIGPTAGYLLAYPLVAAVAGLAGRLVKRRLAPFTAAAIAGTAGSALLLSSGAFWIAHVRLLPLHAVWALAVAPFLFGAGAKIAAAAAIYTTTRRRLRS